MFTEPHPVMTPTPSIYDRAFDAGVDFTTFLEQAEEHREFWHAVAARTELPDEFAARAASLARGLRLVVLADDWCGDAINSLPVVARIGEAAPELALRIVPRDDWPELMERHLTNGARSIPIVAVVDGSGACRGAWGPRPAELQRWFEEVGRPLDPEARYREIRRWYARDRGVSTAREVLEVIESAAASD